MAVNVLFPQLGESVVKGAIVKWHVKPGDFVAKDATLVEVSTDKADNEVPAPVGGTVLRLLAKEGDEVAVNAPIAEIEPGAAGAVAAPQSPAAEAAAASGEGPSSPSVRKLALEKGVDLASVTGTGERGRITHEDVSKASAPAASPAPVAAAPAPVQSAPVASPSASFLGARGGDAGVPVAPGAFTVPAYAQQPGDEIVPFNRRRRIIADHMVYSKHVSPHVMTIAEIDLHKTHRLREQHKGALKSEGINLTFLSFVAAATARALRENPVLNARVLDDAYAKIRRINLGIAVETPQGLVVPVVRDADALTVRGLAKAIDQAAIKARDNKITVDDLSGATFTISNPGLKGNFVGAAIISQPNVGILRIGEIVKRPVVVEVDGVDTIAIHPVMFAALSYDHRIVDGVAANNFLYRVTEILETGAFDL